MTYRPICQHAGGDEISIFPVVREISDRATGVLFSVMAGHLKRPGSIQKRPQERRGSRPSDNLDAVADRLIGGIP